MSSMEMPDAAGVEAYWLQVDGAIKAEGENYLGLFRRILGASLDKRSNKRYRNAGVERTSISDSIEVTWAHGEYIETWIGKLTEKVYEMPPSPDGSVLCAVSQKMTVKGRDNPSLVKIVRPVLYVAQHPEGQAEVTLRDPTELLVQPLELYVDAQKLWFDRLRALAVAQGVVTVPYYQPPMSEAA